MAVVAYAAGSVAEIPAVMGRKRKRAETARKKERDKAGNDLLERYTLPSDPTMRSLVFDTVANEMNELHGGGWRDLAERASIRGFVNERERSLIRDISNLYIAKKKGIVPVGLKTDIITGETKRDAERVINKALIMDKHKGEELAHVALFCHPSLANIVGEASTSMVRGSYYKVRLVWVDPRDDSVSGDTLLGKHWKENGELMEVTTYYKADIWRERDL